MKQKSEVLAEFKEFKSLVERQTGSKIQQLVNGIADDEADSSRVIKTLRSDNGGEYNPTEFENYCKQQGIQHQYTTAYTPQQNGIAERMNRSLAERARCLLFDAGLPKTYWAEAINMAAYIINRSVNSTSNKTQTSFMRVRNLI